MGQTQLLRNCPPECCRAGSNNEGVELHCWKPVLLNCSSSLSCGLVWRRSACICWVEFVLLHGGWCLRFVLAGLCCSAVPRCEVSRVVVAMRGFAFMCCACVAVASSVGDVDGRSGAFLASLSGHRASSSAQGGVEGEYGRETQSPMVWLNLRKSNLDVEALSKGIDYHNYASKRLSGHRAA